MIIFRGVINKIQTGWRVTKIVFINCKLAFTINKYLGFDFFSLKVKINII